MNEFYSYWTFGDVFEELGVPFTPFHGGFGLVANGCITKPTFWTFAFYKKLEESEANCVYKDDNIVVLKRANGDYLEMCIRDSVMEEEEDGSCCIGHPDEEQIAAMCRKMPWGDKEKSFVVFGEESDTCGKFDVDIYVEPGSSFEIGIFSARVILSYYDQLLEGAEKIWTPFGVRPLLWKIEEDHACLLYTSQLMHAISLILIFQATNSIMTKGVLRGGGDTKMLMLADNLFLWVVSIPLGMLAGFVFHFPAFWIYVCLKADQIQMCIRDSWLSRHMNQGTS